MSNRTSESRLRQSRSKGGRPFFAVSERTGEVVRFEHTGEMREQLPELSVAHVYDCLHGNRVSHKGFTFRYDPAFAVPSGKSPGGVKKGPNAQSRAVIGTECETGIEKIYDYPIAVKEDGFTVSAVYGCLAGKWQKHKGWAWRYADGLPHQTRPNTEHLKGARPSSGSRQIRGTHRITGEVVTFEYIQQAASVLGIAASNISAALSSGISAGGYLWDFVNA